MVRHALKILQYLLQNFQSLSYHFGTSCIKGFSTINRNIDILCKLQNLFQQNTCTNMYKSFTRPHLDYGYRIYDQTYNCSFHQKIKSIKFNACYAIRRTIRGTSKHKLYKKLGVGYLQFPQSHRKPPLLQNIQK